MFSISFFQSPKEKLKIKLLIEMLENETNKKVSLKEDFSVNTAGKLVDDDAISSFKRFKQLDSTLYKFSSNKKQHEIEFFYDEREVYGPNTYTIEFETYPFTDSEFKTIGEISRDFASRTNNCDSILLDNTAVELGDKSMFLVKAMKSEGFTPKLLNKDILFIVK